jgi:uncharacterized membrane protein
MMNRNASFTEDRVFVAGWAIFIGLLTFFFLGIVLAPVFERFGAQTLARFLYGFYHLSCHQLPLRSWFLCGEKLGVCVRCFSTYLLLIASGSLLFLKRARYWLAARKFGRFVLPIFLSTLSPLVVDGFVQLLTKWESTNLLRFATGSMAGIGLTVFLGYLFLKVSGAVDESLAHSR